MMRKLTTLFILSFLPFFVQGQSISLDELIQIQKTPKNDLNYIASIIIPNKLKQIESLEETPEDLGRKVWRLSNDAKVSLFYGADVDNRVLFQSNDDKDYNEIIQKIISYKMKLIDNKNEQEIYTYTFLGSNFVIMLIWDNTTFKIGPEYTFEIYKKEDFFENRLAIENSHKVEIGDELLGGIVFYVDETGKHGRVITPFNLSSYTNLIDAYQLKSDFNLNTNQNTGLWKIPSAENLREIYENLSKTGLVKFEYKFFWTRDTFSDSRPTFASIVNLYTGEEKVAWSTDNYALILIKEF